jgi:hypothetical protein
MRPLPALGGRLNELKIAPLADAYKCPMTDYPSVTKASPGTLEVTPVTQAGAPE